MAVGELQNNSQISPLSVDKKSGLVLGFVIANPDRTQLPVDLSQYGVMKSQSDAEKRRVNELRLGLYEQYQFLATNVPAATSAFMSNAHTLPLGVVYRDAEAGEITSLLYLDTNGQFDKRSPCIIKGPVLTKHDVYRGEDGLWYEYSPSQKIMHEQGGHCSAEIQQEALKSTHGDLKADYAKARADGTGPKFEQGPIALVNATMLSPIEQSSTKLDDYFASASGGVMGRPVVLDQQALDALKCAPVPEALSAYSHPTVTGCPSKVDYGKVGPSKVEKHSQLDGNGFDDLKNMLHPNVFAKLTDATRELSDDAKRFVAMQVAKVAVDYHNTPSTQQAIALG